MNEFLWPIERVSVKRTGRVSDIRGREGWMIDVTYRTFHLAFFPPTLFLFLFLWRMGFKDATARS